MCESDPRRVRPFLTSLGCAAPLDPLVASHPRPLRTAGSTAGSDRSRPGARAGTGCSLDLHADPGGLAGGKRACERGDARSGTPVSILCRRRNLSHQSRQAQSTTPSHGWIVYRTRSVDDPERCAAPARPRCLRSRSVPATFRSIRWLSKTDRRSLCRLH
jgi:hypothetical protein